ncbi:putative RNA-binding protein (RRM superfamily) protein [Dioscorea alata]|uniref:RNA-binding protein (RRM superfamily) protein n=1 Tax=Dioscorea alata TaxID=55571 RepID=A0ACB7UMP5_DIOAL|nr:putative RNA-binding protein (RRM superfamily) protein [Dioscorea alata]
MATAAITSLLLSRCLVTTTNKSNTLHPLIPNFNLSNPTTLLIRTLSPFLPLRSRSQYSVVAAAAAYAESDDRDGDSEDGGASASQETPEEAGRLYVGNLPYSMTSSQLAEHFSEAGQVISVDLVYDRVTDRSRGFAFVSMASHDDALNAIRMFDGSEVGGRTMKVNFPEVPRGGEREVMSSRMKAASRGYIDSPHKVYAGNLGWAVTGQSLREAFASQAGILGAKEVEGRPLRLSPAQRKPPPTPGPEVAASQSVDEELMEVH